MLKMKLAKIADVQAGGTPSRTKLEYWNGQIPWIKIANIYSKYVNEYDETITEEGLNNSSAKLFTKGTILFTIFATLGRVGILSFDAATNQAIAAIKLKSDLLTTDYLYYYLRSLESYVKKIGNGAAQQNINLTILKNFDVPIVEKDKQNVITNTLNEIEILISIKREQLLSLDELIKSRFIEMFENKGFPILKWNEVFNTKTGKLDSNAMVPGGQYPFFTCAKEVFSIDNYAFDQEALLLAGNNAAGKYDVKYYKGKFNAYQRTYVLDLKQDWSYQLFRYQLEDKLEWLREQSKGSNTRYITLKILGDLEFIMPPKKLQNEFESFSKMIDKSKFVCYSKYFL